MRVLVVGSGGREHALAWKISQSPLVDKVFCAPGNGGTSGVAENVDIESSKIFDLIEFAKKEKIDLTVVGPELPLTQGITDEFQKNGLKIFGPTRSASRLEGSKIFAKEFMKKYNIPTADFEIVYSEDEAVKIISSERFKFPLLIKADGLAAGKGSVICNDFNGARNTIELMMKNKIFGEAGEKVVIEEFLSGQEVSFIVVSDGEKVIPLVTSQDHKKIFDGDRGPNTGGMGAISPSPYITKEIYWEIMSKTIIPTIQYMKKEGNEFRGVLYAGMILTSDGPKVLEFNCRFGDPENQAILIRMESDLMELLIGAVEGDISKSQVKWSKFPSGCVVVASKGYPDKYETGKIIKGLDKASSIKGIEVFHAGTKKKNSEFLTSGGRVLGVSGCDESMSSTMEKIYRAISVIYFEGMYYRKDIGKGVEREARRNPAPSGAGQGEQY
ncbi:MAG: phosphoribosylamine--glycine ligase [Acidobacteriota bacterium]